MIDYSDAPCYYCAGSGWQTVAYIAESGNENTGVRPCVCSKAPPETIVSGGSYRDRKGDVIARRSDHPLREPEYRKRPGSEIWEKAGYKRPEFPEGTTARGEG